MQTIGWSPKVLYPGLVQLAVGVVLVVLGVLVVGEPMTTIGYTAIGTGVLTLGVGRVADPGTVVPQDGPETGPAPLDHVDPANEVKDLHDAQGA